MKVRKIHICLLIFSMFSTVVKSQCIESSEPLQNSHFIHLKSYDLTGAIISESRTFYDNLGKARVSISKDFITNITWGTETMYDELGRASIQSFPAISCEGFVNEKFLSHPTFSDLQWYYSNQNTLEPYQDIAQQPYIKYNYHPLIPGSLINVTGGNQVNDEWKTSYTYTMPAAQELYYAFGHEYFNGGNYTLGELVISKYTKIVNVDEQGDETVAFVDESGTTVATAYSGGNTSYPVISLIGSNGYVDVHIPKGILPGEIELLGGISNYKIWNLKDGAIVNEVTPGNAYRIESLSSVTLPSKTYISPQGGIEYDDASQGIKYAVNYYDYSLNYFNKAGLLVKTIPPLGFAFTGLIEADPAHTMPTEYIYNVSGNLVYSKSPDTGEAWFVYRNDGKIRYSNNAIYAQAEQVPYTEYDSFGRPVESGILHGANFSEAQQNPDDELIYHSYKSEQIFTIYDFPTNYNSDDHPSVSLYDVLVQDGISTYQAGESGFYTQRNLSGNVAITYNKRTSESEETSLTWYSYDIYGRVEFIVQKLLDLPGVYIIRYSYDHNGNIKQMIYQPHKASQKLIHHYTYDLNGKLIKTETSTDGVNFITQAEYAYYLDGKLKRTSLADGIQGLDYVYNLDGNLKSLNHPTLQSAKDPGNDSNDLFGYAIDYYVGDYSRANTNIASTASGIDRYDGNIKAIKWSNKNFDTYNDNSISLTYLPTQLSFSNNIISVIHPTYCCYKWFYTTEGFLGDGYFEFQVLQDNRTFTMDLQVEGVNGAQSRLQIMFRHRTENTVTTFDDIQVLVHNITGGSISAALLDREYAIGDVYRMERSGSNYIIKKNGVTIFTYPIPNYTAEEMLHGGGQMPGASQSHTPGNNVILGPKVKLLYISTSAERSSVYLYEYNEKKWLRSAKFGEINYFNGNVTLDPDDNYLVDNIEYESNGNLKRLHRRAKKMVGTPYGDSNHNKIDWLTYIYNPGTNQLNYVSDFITNVNDIVSQHRMNPEFTTDIRDQDPDNFIYNSIGQLIRNVQDDLNYYYTSTGLISEITKNSNPLVKFYYNERGQRIKKESFNINNNNEIIASDLYIYDVSGNVMAIYTQQLNSNQVSLIQQPVYGMTRLGMYNRQDESTLYELTDHLGNVRVTFTKQNTQPVMQSWADYYPFGMRMPYRDFNSSNYRYAFQGQERDPETGMEAFELRLWDNRIGRWLTPDPYGQYHSPYMGMGNNPISMIDLDGGFAEQGCCDWFKKAANWISKQANSIFSNNPEYTEIPDNEIKAYYEMEPAVITSVAKSTTPRNNTLFGMTFALSSSAELLGPSIEIVAPAVGEVAAPVLAAGAVIGAGYLLYNANDSGTNIISVADARLRGIPLATAGNITYNMPVKPGFNVEEILALQALSSEMIHQMGKGGNQRYWDHELSPLSDAELLALLQEAIRTSNKSLKRRIVLEQKRRGGRNKDKDRGRGDVR